ncbi:MAG TPA: FHA domain-containing protein [Gemmatimonadaceae bacterium]
MTDDPLKPASYLVYEVERRAYPLGDAPFSIGRDASSGIVIREPAVSRNHAEVRREGDGFVLNPVGATTTRLNGNPVTGPAKLTDGDRIEVGSVEISYREGRLPLGVSVVDSVDDRTHDPDAITRRPTITNPILAKEAAPKKKSATGALILVVILIAVAAWYFLGAR